MFAMSSKPFFRKAFHELKITHEFSVSDQQFLTCGGVVGCGMSKHRFLQGYPPVTLHRLSTFPREPHDPVLIEKPIQIYLSSTSIPTNGEGDWTANQDYTDIFHVSSIILPPFAGQMTALLDKQVTAIRTLVLEAQQRGPLEASEVRLKIIPAVMDMRRNREAPVPAPAPREIVIP